jgi:hypothetical protein
MQAEGKGHLSCSQADTTFFGVERDASIDRGPSCGLRRDGKLTFHQMDSFTHADERSGTPGPPFFAEVRLRFSFDRYPEFPTRMRHNLCLSTLTVPRLFPMK